MTIPSGFPQRIVCLTEETTETLYLLGEEWRIVGISGFTVRPARARKEKPRVSAFTSAKIERIVALEPDLVLGFSDLQADIAADLIRAGVAVHVFNQRDIAGILAMIRTLGALVGAAQRADQLAAGYEKRLASVAATASASSAPASSCRKCPAPSTRATSEPAAMKSRGLPMELSSMQPSSRPCR